MGNSSHDHPPYLDANAQIPIDLFVSKTHKKKGVGSRSSYIGFTDSFGNLVTKVERPPKDHRSNLTTNSHPIKLLLDASGNTLFSIHKLKNGSWQCFRVNDSGENLIFRAEKTLDKLTRTEFDIFLVGGNGEDSKPDLKMKGCPFMRSCTIYKGDSIVAETSLMYKLGLQKSIVPRSRFRVTFFPGFSDHGLVVALIIIFFHGRKLWV